MEKEDRPDGQRQEREGVLSTCPSLGADPGRMQAAFTVGVNPRDTRQCREVVSQGQ